jgi:hypothetical protein
MNYGLVLFLDGTFNIIDTQCDCGFMLEFSAEINQPFLFLVAPQSFIDDAFGLDKNILLYKEIRDLQNQILLRKNIIFFMISKFDNLLTKIPCEFRWWFESNLSDISYEETETEWLLRNEYE